MTDANDTEPTDTESTDTAGESTDTAGESTDTAGESTDTAGESTDTESTGATGAAPADGGKDDQDLVDRSAIDFDPDDGYLAGTAIDGTSEIPDPEEQLEQAKANGEIDSDAGTPGSESSESAASAESAESSQRDPDRPLPGPGDDATS